MMYCIYSMKDKLVGYDYPMLLTNDSEATRTFAEVLRSNDKYSYKKNDMELYRLGKFDSVTGEIIEVCNDLIVKGDSIE